MSPSARDIHPTDEDLSVGTPDMGCPAFRMGLMEGSAWTPMSPSARDMGHPVNPARSQCRPLIAMGPR